jgi:hypothetical protein
MADQPQKPAGATFTFVDLPELPETFADTVHGLFFDGQTLRITFAANRMEALEPSSNSPIGKRYPVARLVLTAAGATELMNQMKRLEAAMSQAQDRAKSEGGAERPN